MTKRLASLLVLGGVSLTLGSALLSRTGTAQDKAPRKVQNFTLTGADGKPVTLNGFKDAKAFAVIFLGTQCPVNNQFLPRLAELHKDYSARGVQFLAINSNHQDDLKAIAEHARKHEIPFPVLRDQANRVADDFGARRTPEAFVLDATFAIRYQGRIDDQFGVGFQRPAPTRRDLAVALDEVLDGKPVTQATTAVEGCLIGRAPRAKGGAEVTYTKHIAPILQAHCQECHRPGQIGPMSLMSYHSVSAWSEMIREVVTEGRMPPWHADPKHGKWSNDRSLPAEARATLLKWIDLGCPRGDDADLPPPKNWPDGWKIGTPDVVFEMKEAFEVPAQTPKNGVPYQYFEVETNFTEDKWVERAECKPGAPEVVHHIIVFIVPEEVKFNRLAPTTPTLAGTAPGDMPLMLTPGMARLVPKGARLVFQMHYTPNGKAQKDRSKIGLIFAKQPPRQVVTTIPVYNAFFSIPAGADNHQVKASYTFKKEGYIVGFMPHMHLRGKDFLYKVVYPDGTEQTLLSVPRFDFGWQSVYRPAEPLKMPVGARLECVAHFDNSRGNRNNPDPTSAVRWGDQTWQEMMIGWTDIAYDLEKK